MRQEGDAPLPCPPKPILSEAHQPTGWPGVPVSCLLSSDPSPGWSFLAAFVSTPRSKQGARFGRRRVLQYVCVCVCLQPPGSQPLSAALDRGQRGHRPQLQLQMRGPSWGGEGPGGPWGIPAQTQRCAPPEEGSGPGAGQAVSGQTLSPPCGLDLLQEGWHPALGSASQPSCHEPYAVG